MGQYADQLWYQNRVAALFQEYGAVPPPWAYAPDSHPYSLRWRMGDGETLIMVFSEWWEGEQMEFDARVEYFRKWPPPPRWLPWMADVLWDLKPWEAEDEFDYKPYFAKLAELGFPGGDDYERDLNDEKWLKAECDGDD